MQSVQETEADENNEEDLTVTHRKHLRFFGVRWRYLRMSIAVLISICFAVAGILLHKKQKGLVSLCPTWHGVYCYVLHSECPVACCVLSSKV